MVLSTQALLVAVGVGNSSAAPMAAALNWVMKDGGELYMKVIMTREVVMIIIIYLQFVLISSSFDNKIGSWTVGWSNVCKFIGKGWGRRGLLEESIDETNR